MKLGFNKADDGNVFAVILNGTEQEKFSYIKMISALIEGQAIECEFGDGITLEEQVQINALKDAIRDKIHPIDEKGQTSLF